MRGPELEYSRSQWRPFAFGQMTEHRLRELEARPMMEQWILEAVVEVRGRIADFGERLQTQPVVENFVQL